jgi:hypothetical protein
MLLFAAAISSALSLNAQTQRCGSDAAQRDLIAAHPEMAAQIAALRAGTSQIANETPISNRFPQAILTIPVVFHVIHSGEAVGSGRNLSLTRLQSQLQTLNLDYSKTNADAGSIPAQFQGIAANTEIQFCMATIDPLGNPTTGVSSKPSNLLLRGMRNATSMYGSSRCHKMLAARALSWVMLTSQLRVWSALI